MADEKETPELSDEGPKVARREFLSKSKWIAPAIVVTTSVKARAEAATPTEPPPPPDPP